MPRVLIKRGTRSQINAARDAAGLNAGEMYLVTDENTLAVGTSATSYADVGPTTNHGLLTGRDTVDSHPASAITNTPSGNIAATDVQSAINELDQEKQPLDADLTAIAALAGTSGLLKKTAADTWALDTSTHLVSTDLGVTVQAYDADIPTVSASQAEMEAGTESALRSMSPANIKQAIVKQAQAIPDLTIESASTTLHRSPNAITAMFVYDTSKASDGGAFIEKLGATSIVNEPLNGKWLGQQANESAARAVSGAATGDFYQLTSDGKVYKLNESSGVTQVYRGNSAKWPRLMALVAESLGLFVYDLTQAGRPLFRHFPVGANEIVIATPTSIQALESTIAIGTASGLVLMDFARDVAKKLTTGTDQAYKGFLAKATAGWA